MSTYIISDIHGHLDLFKNLLGKIKFDFDKDNLYLLGDYVDWGPKSIDTLLYIMDIDEKYKNVHVLIGNHDLMFLNQASNYFNTPFYEDDNWMWNNNGATTFKQFLEQSEDMQHKIVNYLNSLPYREDIIVNGKKYILAHSCPVDFFIYNEKLSEEDNNSIFNNNRYEAVWERILRKVPSVIRWYDKNNEYENFVCGHTINSNYKITKIKDSYIDIDCGAKIIGYQNFEHENLAHLACLRLDDMKEYYVR